jgi:hypothetical protein
LELLIKVESILIPEFPKKERSIKEAFAEELTKLFLLQLEKTISNANK